MRILRTAAGAATLAIAALAFQPSAHATIIDFGGLSDGAQPLLGVYNEDGFTVTPEAGEFREAHFFGNPTPSIFTGIEGVNTISIVNGGLFAFLGLDFGCGTGGSAACGYSAVGKLGSSTVFDFDVLGGTVSTFTRLDSLDQSSLIDRLELTIIRRDSNFDNIELAEAAVPLPAALPLLAAGLGAFGFMGWRRRQASA